VRIGELSAATGVSPRSLRYYEQQGLIAAERRPNGYREYGPDAMPAVLTIRALLDLGLPLDLVRDVQPCAMAGADVDRAICNDVIARVTGIRDEIAERVLNLSRTRDLLTGFLDGSSQSVTMPAPGRGASGTDPDSSAVRVAALSSPVTGAGGWQSRSAGTSPTPSRTACR
jgi:DNA-binding transcriptional MerR regulator